MYDVILIFGHLVDKNGNLSKEQILRIKKGTELFKKKEAKYLMVSGGFGKHFNQTNKSLGWYMKKFSIKQGINPKKIFIESKSFETIDNIIFSKRIIDRKKWKSIILVSSRYHIPRIKMICKYVFHKGYKLKFISTNTPNFKKKEILKNEKKYITEDEEWLKRHYKSFG